MLIDEVLDRHLQRITNLFKDGDLSEEAYVELCIKMMNQGFVRTTEEVSQTVRAGEQGYENGLMPTPDKPGSRA